VQVVQLLLLLLLFDFEGLMSYTLKAVQKHPMFLCGVMIFAVIPIIKGYHSQLLIENCERGILKLILLYVHTYS